MFRDRFFRVRIRLLQLTGESVVLTERAGCAFVKPQADALRVEHVHGVAWQGGNQGWGLLCLLLLINTKGITDIITRALGVIRRYRSCSVIH